MKVYVVEKDWNDGRGLRMRAFTSEEAMRNAVEENVRSKLDGTITSDVEHISMFGYNIDSINIYRNGEHLPDWGLNYEIVEIED